MIENEKVKGFSLKKKVAITIFYISFIPYLILLALSAYNAISGMSFFFSTCIGFEAFLVTIIVYGVFFAPVFVACLIYQIVFAVLTRGHSEYKHYNKKKFFIVLVSISVLSILCSVLIDIKSEIEYRNRFEDKELSDVDYFVLPYDNNYDVDSAKVISYYDLCNFFWEHVHDFEAIDSEFPYYDDSESDLDYILLVSPVIEGTVVSRLKPVVTYSDAQEKVKIKAGYTVSHDTYDKYVVVYVLSGHFQDFYSSFGDYELETEFNQINSEHHKKGVVYV